MRLTTALILAIAAVALVATTPALAQTPCEAPHIQAHLELVEAELLAADTSGLTPTQRANRARQVEVLRTYREACAFPHNTLAADRITPVFIDDRGVHCAVGHLMAQDGRGDLARRIADHRNTTTIQELAGDPEVAAWLVTNGLTWHEAARIQPSYVGARSDCLCGRLNCCGAIPLDVEGIAEGTITSVDGDRVTIEVTRWHGAGTGATVEATAIPSDEVGRPALVLDLVDQTDLARHVEAATDGESVACMASDVSAPTDLYVEALLSEDCHGTLAAADPAYGTPVTYGPGVIQPNPPQDGTDLGGGGGCASGGSSAPWAWLALGLLAVLALRRRRALGLLSIVGLAATTIGLLAPSSARAEAPCEAPHIQAHLAQVESELLAADTSDLTPAQRANRARQVEVLRTYREACAFPYNTLAADRITPIFIDDRGVHCAVGHLMAQDGRGDLARRIADHRNTTTIQELAGDPEVAAWLTRNGLTWHDADRIQPQYMPGGCHAAVDAQCLCAGAGPMIDGVAEGLITEIVDAEARVRVTVKHGAGPEVGEHVTISVLDDDFVGRRVLVPVFEGELAEQAFVGVVSDAASCVVENGRVASVSTELYVDALMSQDCRATLEAHDPALTELRCDTAPVEAGLSGCGAGDGTPPWPWLGLALLVLMATAARPRRSPASR